MEAVISEPALYNDAKAGIIYRKWECRSPKAVFLLVHGLGGHSGRWEFLADFFLHYERSSYAIELKGFGETKDLRGHIDSFDTYLKDIVSLHEIIKRENSGAKIFLLGESMGALISFLTAAKNPNLFNGLICISPAFKSRLKFGFLGYLKIFTLLIINPKKRVSVPFNSMMCTRDVKYQKLMDNDSREYRLATPRLLLNIALAGRQATAIKDNIRTPVLFLVAGEYDRLIDPAAAQNIFGGLQASGKEMIRYPQMCHALSIDLDKEKVFGDILKWVEKRI
ncbi:MAG: lysophospholipase [Candidatus Omnitrophica bacterium]|nr:lysophospholipase [Candidatus Omnitrophota bacterium]